MADHAASNTGLILGDGTYDILRQFVEKLLPGFGALYFAFATIWDWPAADNVVASCAALAVFGGILLTFARKGYIPEQSVYDGPFAGQVVEGITENGEPTLKLELDTRAANDVLNAKYLVFKGFNSA